jgi:type II secretory pathway pseudopilin PulG
MNTFRISNRHGTTLIELLIAITLTGIITLAIMKTYVTQHENYLVQNDVTTMQQGARASIDELTRQIRMAGHHLPIGLPPIEAADTNPDTITITYHGNECDTYLSAAMPTTSAELKCGGDISCFEADQWVYIWEPDTAKGEWFQISEVQADAFHLQHRYDPKELSRKYGANSIILALNRVKFFIDNTTMPDNPRLMVQVNNNTPEPYADHVVDLQFQYRLANGTIVDEPIVVSDVREVLMSVSVESTLAQLPERGNDSQEDAPKLRTYATSVSVRNIAI